MSPKQLLTGVVIAAIFIFVSRSAFIVDQRDQVLVMQFGNIVSDGAITNPGLHWKLPWQNTVVFDKRLLASDDLPNEVITKDKKKIIVDSFTRWKIIDPLKVYQVAKTRNRVESRMQDVVGAKVREVLGQHTLHEIVTGGEGGDKRAALMVSIRDLADAEVANLGVKVIDVRIKRADLPAENSDSVFRRMKAERQRIAKQYRSEGEEAAKEIRATADKESKFLLADAYKQSEIIKGNADAKATKIYASTYEKDPKFYAFTRSLEAYRKSMATQSRVVLSPNSEFFRFFETSK
ncbi:protease modulator HflC [Ghiorsea bivora]|uniref:protease modulator HflC n=1 Tax=Ghiorsea bivora TaxID=1485545 RepID=UPI00056FF4B9|nr:protease modulator HflC [Ghiorsea bivora]